MPKKITPYKDYKQNYQEGDITVSDWAMFTEEKKKKKNWAIIQHVRVET